MATRAETAAATRRALLDATASLLDEGGPDAVTLRQVGARAGVSRGAPYGHFADKEELLTALAIDQWVAMTGELSALRSEPSLAPEDRLRAALLATLDVARHRPYLYALMFRTPSRDPEKLIAAASASQDVFLDIVADVVGEGNARPSGALLMSSTHGIAGMESSGQLNEAKWGTTGEGIVDALIRLVGR